MAVAEESSEPSASASDAASNPRCVLEGEVEEGREPRGCGGGHFEDVDGGEPMDGDELPREEDVSPTEPADVATDTGAFVPAPCRADGGLLFELIEGESDRVCMWIEPGPFEGGNAAEEACKLRAGRLASIEGPDEQGASARLVAAEQQGGEPWIGLVGGPDWTWLDGSTSEARYWSSSWPRDVMTHGTCVLVTRGGTWQQAICSAEDELRPALCKMRFAGPPATTPSP